MPFKESVLNMSFKNKIIIHINNVKEPGMLGQNNVEKKKRLPFSAPVLLTNQQCVCHGHSYSIRFFSFIDALLITIIMALLINES